MKNSERKVKKQTAATARKSAMYGKKWEKYSTRTRKGPKKFASQHPMNDEAK
jgi:hypothetical protein